MTSERFCYINMINNLNIMATKSIYYGYTLRTPNSPYQQWALSQLPIPVSAMFTSTSTDEVAVDGIIPISSTSLNQVGGVVNTDGTFSLPSGMYKISFITLLDSTATTGVAKVSLNAGTTSVLSSSVAVGNGEPVTVSGEIILSCSGCNVKWSLVNSSTFEVTPDSMGMYTAQVIVDRIL
jgi:hypothetical protein